MAVKFKPDGYHAVTPYLVVTDAANVIAFAKAAFGAVEMFRMPAPGGRIGHAELRIDDSAVMLADAPAGRPAMPAMLHLYVEDVDAAYDRALSAGGIAAQPAANQFYGDRTAEVRDASGNLWHISTHIEDVPPDELKRRVQELMHKAGG